MPTIPQLPVATQVNTGDLFVIDQVSVTKSATGSLVQTFIETNITIAESQVTGLTADLAAKLAKASNLSDVASASQSRINLGLPALTNGQLWIGQTSSAPAAANLTAGTNISITNASGTITIAATGAGGFSWTEVTGTSQTMVSNSGYISSNGSLVVLTLPAASSVGDEMAVVGKGAGGWKIAASGGQNLRLGSSNATSYLASSNQYDSIYLVCTVANTTWTTLGAPQGNITIV